MITSRLLKWLAASVAGIGLIHSAAYAQSPAPYPNRQLQLIVPFPAGGPTDIVARLYAQQLSKLAGQPVVVENMAGAAGMIGTQNAVRAEPNGYTILFSTASTSVINEVVQKKVPYNFQRDFSMIGLIADAPHVLVIGPSVPANNVAELIALAKKEPGKLSYSSAGTGSIVQMGAELFRTKSGIELMHVPYKGGAPATMAVLRGEVSLNVNDLSTFKSQIAEGKLKPLAVAHTSRLKPLPDVPTFIELGMPEIVSSSWWGIAVPTKTPAAIQTKLREWNQQIVTNPEYIARLADMAFETINMTPEQTKAFIDAEIKKWQTVAKAANIQLD
ncbi:Bug family tripartite tricarboxylate transporter substrate binding protein [Zwartia panacis]|uniref:Bug family tripartite tricarboxylate transporter substrate binding protein n=1 Tax=Zwartia panacis TaxID=2683345 RepID=UPI0025B5C039|nr:tripartite tricarboxylate transporter substrate binding protein [Zwartia panacis]MDN4016615.1 tripartite tricarboxylate transporter substrate binding protein [Zwartia panacis]